jgi:hypothetical protein
MPADGGADASADAAPSDASAAPFLGAWQYNSDASAPRLGGGTVMGQFVARATFDENGSLEATAEMTVDGCVVHTEHVHASYQWPGADVIFIRDAVCTDVDTSTCTVRTHRLDPANPCYLLNSTWVRNTLQGEWTISDGGLSINRSAPWSRVR